MTRPDPQAAFPERQDRRALVIATSNYGDDTLAKLRSPGEDAKQLAAVLADERIGRFDVDTLIDAPADTIRRRIAQFCKRGGPQDLALLYLSCHGVLDDRGRLYYATPDTERELLSVTAVPAAWLIEHLEDCKCRQQILILDCCHSGAFARGAKGSPDLGLQQRVEGRGRVVLTASRATEYAFEGDRVVGEGASSVFTGALIDGLKSGDADSDQNGLITVNELYDFAYHAVKTTDARQNPCIWSYGAEGSLLIAHSPRGAVIKPAALPESLRIALENPGPRIREGAVAELADLLTGADAARAITARGQLEHIAEHDVALVAGAARRTLAAHPEAAAPAAGSVAIQQSVQPPATRTALPAMLDGLDGARETAARVAPDSKADRSDGIAGPGQSASAAKPMLPADWPPDGPEVDTPANQRANVSATAAILGEGQPESATPAGFWKRAGAILLDWPTTVFLGIILLTAMRAIGGDGIRGDTAVYVSWTLAAVVYFTLMEGAPSGQTLGKRALGIHVRDAAGAGAIGYPRALIRFVGRGVSVLFSCLGYLWMLRDNNNQTWHDKLSRSVVVLAMPPNGK